MKKSICILGVFCAVALSALSAEETHAERIVGDILANVAKVKAADPQAVPMAFWDFDGTLIAGDLEVGCTHRGEPILYPGIIRRAIEEGLIPIYDRKDGWRKFWEEDYLRMSQIGRWLAWPYLAQMLNGISVRELDAFCAREFEKIYRKWYYASSVKMLRALESAGVENYVVSAGPELYIRNASDSLGLPRERFRGIRVEIVGGRVTTRLVHPVPSGEGKVENLRDLVLERPHGVAVAGFGNSYSTDGAFLRYVACQPSLPGRAKGTAVMINGGKVVPGYTEHFICVDQTAVVGEARCGKIGR